MTLGLQFDKHFARFGIVMTLGDNTPDTTTLWDTALFENLTV